MSFSSDVKAFARKTGMGLDKTSRAIKISLFTGIIKDTRVDTGRLRGNWQTSTGTPKFTAVERLFPNGTPESTLTQEVISNVQAFSIDYMTNNLPYAQVWEERDGMVEKNIARTMNEVKIGAYGRN